MGAKPRETARSAHHASVRALRRAILYKLRKGAMWVLGDYEFVTAVRFRDGRYQHALWQTPDYQPDDEAAWSPLQSAAIALDRMTAAHKNYAGDDGDLALLLRARQWIKE